MQDIEQGSTPPQEFCDLFRIYANSNYQSNDIYNSFIRGFGTNFDSFNEFQLVNFCGSINQIGLRQEDIFKTVTDRIITDLSSKGTHDPSDFNKLHLKLLDYVMHLALHDTEILKTLTSSTQACYGMPFE